MDRAIPDPQQAPGVGLRYVLLTTPPDKFDFSADADFPTVYGVLTDWNLADTTATIVGLRDGTASLYTTGTFGIIGGFAHEAVRSAALRYVQAAEQLADYCVPVTDFPYPAPGDVTFYLLTYDGVVRCEASEQALAKRTDPTTLLFAAAQDVLTQLRLIVN